MSDHPLRNITNFTLSREYRNKIHQLIPGGAHTYSKGDDQFPQLAPAAISYGKGSHVWDIDGNEFLDCSMGLTSVTLGHAFAYVTDAVKKELDKGVNFQRPSYIEMEMAEKFLEIVPQHDMIKFAKNGSIVTTAAVKLARAQTGRKLVAFPGDHPFYSYDDWFIGKTLSRKGVPEEISALSVTFSSYNITSLRKLFNDYPGQIACVITEPVRNFDGDTSGFIREAIELTHREGALFVLDEMITGYKADFAGCITKYGFDADMATWGKAIANGFSFCALTGKKEVMRLGGINRPGQEKVFLVSTTHGGETHGIAAGLATLQFYKENNVIGKNQQTGAMLRQGVNAVIREHELDPYIGISDTDWMHSFIFRDSTGNSNAGFRTLMMQEMIKRGVLFQGAFVPCYMHTEEDIQYFTTAFDAACGVYKQALNTGYERLLAGEAVKPVFRKIL